MIDMRHRLSTFILKNPPEGDSATPQKMKKLKKEKGKQENGDTSPNDEDDESGFDGWSDEVKVNGEHENGDAEDNDDWGEDTSEEAIKKRMEGLGDGVKTLTFNNDLDKSIETIQHFLQFC